MYKAILFHPEGDYVTDYRDTPTKEEVWERINDQGSRWIFYPLPFVCTDKTVVDTPEQLEFLKGKRIKTVQAYLSDVWKAGDQDFICNAISDGALFAVYQEAI
jgi:hypothetical protein